MLQQEARNMKPEHLVQLRRLIQLAAENGNEDYTKEFSPEALNPPAAPQASPQH